MPRCPIIFFVGICCLAALPPLHGQCPTSAVSTYPFIESFDGFGATSFSTAPPADWEQVPGDNGGGADSDWYFLDGPTVTAGTGPQADHTTGTPGAGFYAYVEDSGGEYAAVSLDSPCLDLSPLATPRLSFWFHSNNSQGPGGPNENTLTVDIVEFPQGGGGPIVHPDVFTTGHAGDLWKKAVIDLSPWLSSTIRVRFRASSDGGSFTHDIAIDDIRIGEAVVFDVGVSTIVSPVSVSTCGAQLSVAESVSVTVFNHGTESIPAGTSIDIEYQLDQDAAVAEVFLLAAPLSAGESVVYGFATPIDLAFDGTHVLAARTTSPDNDSGNDGTTLNIVTGIAATVTTFPWNESFDVLPQPATDTNIPPLCWEQDPTDSGGTGGIGDWLFRNLPTDTIGTGPDADHTTGVVGQGYYAYLEDGGSFADIGLLTPPLDLTTLVHPTLSFWMWSFNGASDVFDNELSIDVLDGSSQVLMSDLVGPLPPGAAAWTRRVVDLTSFAGQTIRLRIRGNTDGGFFLNDLAVDDISVYEGIQEGGHPPQPGAAVLDINTSRNLAGFPVPSLASGIYYATVDPGDNVTFHFEGEPGQAIILFEGPKNIGAHVFQLIGNQQLDVGGPNDPMTGLPTQINILVSGTDPDPLSMFFQIAPIGATDLVFSVPVAVSGQSFVFQSAIFNSVTAVRLSNAVQLDID